MSLVQVDPAGLQSLAGRCSESAVELAGSLAPPTAGLSFQPTSAAVSLVHSDVGSLSQILTRRLEATAARLAAAATRYAGQEDANAADVRAVATTAEP